MSEKKMTDDELAKISGAGDKSLDPPAPELDPAAGDGGGGQPGELDNESPGADPADFQRT